MFLSANNFFRKITIADNVMTLVGQYRKLGRPEATLTGARYFASRSSGRNGSPWVVRESDAGTWIFANTGLEPGSPFGSGGIEVDGVSPASPPGTEVVAEIPNVFGDGRSAQMTYYEAPSGARVFSAGAFTLAGAVWQPPVSQMMINLIDGLSKPAGVAEASLRSRLAFPADAAPARISLAVLVMPLAALAASSDPAAAGAAEDAAQGRLLARRLPGHARPSCGCSPSRHWGFDGKPHTGQLVVNEKAAAPLARVREALRAALPDPAHAALGRLRAQRLDPGHRHHGVVRVPAGLGLALHRQDEHRARGRTTPTGSRSTSTRTRTPTSAAG